MFWMETLIIVGLVVAMAAVVTLIVGPMGRGVRSFEQDDDFHSVTEAWSRERNRQLTR